MQDRLEIFGPHLECRFDDGTDFRPILDGLDCQRNSPKLARELVGAQCHRLFLRRAVGFAVFKYPKDRRSNMTRRHTEEANRASAEGLQTATCRSEMLHRPTPYEDQRFEGYRRCRLARPFLR